MVCSTTAIAEAQQAAAKPPGYKQSMTPWGEPDLRGTWPLNHLISTPFQRPEQFGERRFLTDEEFAAAQKRAEDRNTRFLSGAIPQADAGEATRLTSLLVDPPNGRFPALTPKGKELYDQMRGSYKPGQTVFDSPEDFDTWDRCITRGLPVSMLPRNYNNGIRIMQFPGYVVILLEMAHEARIIPTTKRPALDGAIRQYLGESRGRWEGNTLVVETTNFNGKPAMTNLGVPGSPPLTPATANLRFTERFTRTASDTIDYQMTVEDPEVLTTGKWSAAFPLKLDNDYKMYQLRLPRRQHGHPQLHRDLAIRAHAEEVTPHRHGSEQFPGGMSPCISFHVCHGTTPCPGRGACGSMAMYSSRLPSGSRKNTEAAGIQARTVG